VKHAHSAGFITRVNGAVPFYDPFGPENFYDRCDPSLWYSEALGHVSRDAWLAALIPNLATWAKNPVAYEAGQMTLPNAVYAGVSGLSAVDRGKASIAMYGLIGAFTPTGDLSAYRNTIGTGLTPLGYLALIGALEGLDAAYGNDDPCPCP